MHSNLVTIAAILATLAALAYHSAPSAASSACQHDARRDLGELVYCSACGN